MQQSGPALDVSCSLAVHLLQQRLEELDVELYFRVDSDLERHGERIQLSLSLLAEQVLVEHLVTVVDECEEVAVSAVALESTLLLHLLLTQQLHELVMPELHVAIQSILQERSERLERCQRELLADVGFGGAS